jgi:2-C-methyl-D-erythritol 4-phosphate cytidylyltransferase
VKKFDCIIVAGGSGTRLGNPLPKAFVPLGGKPLFVHSLLTFDSFIATESIVLVIPENMRDETRQILSSYTITKKVLLVSGGPIRWQSVTNGLAKATSEWVMIHDSARPFVTSEIISETLKVSDAYNAVIVATPEIDTVRKYKADKALATLDRSEILRVQTPQFFKRSLLEKAFAVAATIDNPPTDESMLMDHIGEPVGVAWASQRNFKVTTREDLEMAEAIIKYSENKLLKSNP